MPLQPPDAVHDDAFVELHVNVEALPLPTEAGFAVSVAVGTGTTVTVAVATLLVPPVPLHVKEYDAVDVIAPVVCMPLVALTPPQLPDAAHDVAFVELHVSVAAPPLATDVGFAASATVGAGTTVTVAVATLLVPPVPVQVKEYDDEDVIAPVLWLPRVALLPLQPPEAVHEVALVELHVSVEVPPPATEGGFAASIAVGVPGTVTVAVATLLVPPVPVQVNEYEFVAVSAPVLCAPLVDLVPLHPPEAVHEVALVELHVSVEAPPLATVVGFAVSATIAAGTTVTSAVATLLAPAAPVQVNEYDAAAVSGPVLWLPFAALAPLQFPDAVHETALVELHVRVEAPPLATETGFALNATVAVPGTVTVAVATLLAPPAPTHVNEYIVVAASAPVLWLPLVAVAPLQPPDAVHEVALVELHVSVEAAAVTTVFGLAVNATVGAGTTLTMAVATLLVPPVPVQANE